MTVVLGVAPKPRSGRDRAQETDFLDTEINPSAFPSTRIYNTRTWTGTNAEEAQIIADGRTILMSFGTGGATYAAIAAGTYDADLDALGDGLVAAGTSNIIVSFQHEPEGRGLGTPSEYVSAYQHFMDRIRARGATNESVVILQGFTANPASSHYPPSQFDPGPTYRDGIGFDAYNWFQRDGVWRSFATVFSAVRTWMAANLPTVPIWITEVGTDDDPNNSLRKAQWITDALVEMKANWPKLKAFYWFNSQDPAGYQWYFDQSPYGSTWTNNNIAAFKQFANDPYFYAATGGGGSPPPPPPVVTPSGSATGVLRRCAAMQEYNSPGSQPNADAFAALMSYIWAPDLTYLAGMATAAPDCSFGPYAKGVMWTGTTSDNGLPTDFPESWYTHSSAIASHANRVNSPAGNNIWIMNPASTATWTDTSGEAGTVGGVYHGWRDFHKHWLKKLIQAHGQYDQTFADSLGTQSLNGQVDPATGKLETATTWFLKLDNLYNDATTGIKPFLHSAGFKVYPNGLVTNPNVYHYGDGGFLENALRKPTDGDLSSITTSALQAAFSTHGQRLMDCQKAGKAAFAQTQLLGLGSGAISAWSEFVAACAYMFDLGELYWDFNVDRDPTYDIGNPWTQDIGAALTTPSVIGDLHLASAGAGGLYGRRYDKGFAIANTSGGPLTYTLPRSDYLYLDSSPVGASITVPAHTGYVLATTISDPGGGGGGGGDFGDGGDGGTGTGSPIPITYPSSVAPTTWVMKLFDIDGNFLIDLSEAYNRTLHFELNGVDSCTFSLPLDTPDGQSVLTESLIKYVKVWRRVHDPVNGIDYQDDPQFPVFAGVVAGTVEDAAANEMQVTVYGAFWRLQHRYHRDKHVWLATDSTIGPITGLYLSDPSMILWQLIKFSNHNIPYTNGDQTGIIGPGYQLWDTYGEFAAYSPDIRFTVRTPRGQNTWSKIQELVAQDGWPDLVPLYTHLEGARRLQYFNTVIVRGVRPADASVKFEYRTGLNNIDNIRRTTIVDPGSFATLCVVQGQSDSEGAMVMYPKTFDSAAFQRISDVGLYETWEKHDSKATTRELQDYAKAQYKRLNGPIKAYEVELNPVFPPYFKVHFDLGDVIQVSCNHGSMVFSNIDQRIYQIDLSMSDNNIETCQVTMARDFTGAVPA